MLLSGSAVFICGGLTDQGFSRRGEEVKCADTSQFANSKYLIELIPLPKKLSSFYDSGCF